MVAEILRHFDLWVATYSLLLKRRSIILKFNTRVVDIRIQLLLMDALSILLVFIRRIVSLLIFSLHLFLILFKVSSRIHLVLNGVQLVIYKLLRVCALVHTLEVLLLTVVDAPQNLRVTRQLDHVCV